MSRKREFSSDESPVDIEVPVDTPIIAAEAPADPAAVQTLPLPEAPARPLVDIGVFCAVSGVKPDQLSGFKSWVKREGTKSLTVPQWREMYEKFQKRAV